MKTIVNSILMSAVIGLAASCTDRGSTPGERDVAKIPTGKLDLALQAVSDSGKVYRLRNANFEIEAPATLNTPKVLRSEDDPLQPVLETFLAPGSYFSVLDS